MSDDAQPVELNAPKQQKDAPVEALPVATEVTEALPPPTDVSEAISTSRGSSRADVDTANREDALVRTVREPASAAGSPYKQPQERLIVNLEEEAAAQGEGELKRSEESEAHPQKEQQQQELLDPAQELATNRDAVPNTRIRHRDKRPTSSKTADDILTGEPRPASITSGHQPQPQNQIIAQRRRSSRYNTGNQHRYSSYQLIQRANEESQLYQRMHLNGHQMTTAEEYEFFRRRYHVHPNYRGPVYVPEDVMAPCNSCGGPLDPISRVPVGSVFFHLACLECYICKKKGITEPFIAVSGVPVCSGCAERGYAKTIRQEIIKSHSAQPLSMKRKGLPSTMALNHAVLAGATAPSLTINPLHNRRNTSRRSFLLMQRQQYYTQSDANHLMPRQATNTGSPVLLPTLQSRRQSQATPRLT